MANIRNPYPTFLINLESRPDRLLKATLEASKIASQVDRIVAIDGSIEVQRNLGLLTNSQHACFESHKMAFRQFLHSASTHALILEDDLLVTHPKSFAKAISHVNILEFDLVQFGYLKMGVRHRIDLLLVGIEGDIFKLMSRIFGSSVFLSNRYGQRLRIRRQKLNLPGFVQGDIRSGSHCYLISRSLAEYISNLTPPYNQPIDSFLGILQYTEKFQVARSRRCLVTQSNSPSSIKGNS